MPQIEQVSQMLLVVYAGDNDDRGPQGPVGMSNDRRSDSTEGKQTANKSPATDNDRVGIGNVQINHSLQCSHNHG